MHNQPVPSINLLEQQEFADLFTQFPPVSFLCRQGSMGVPTFFTHFDLLTTLEADIRATIRRLPLFRHWATLLKFPTCFCGTTITEYAPFPAATPPTPPDCIITAIKEAYGNKHSLVIIKDIPVSSPLLSQHDNTFSGALAKAAAQQGFIEVQGQALAYVPIDFADEKAYLERLSASRRKDLRRKMKKKSALTIERWMLGDTRFSDQALLDTLYSMYMAVYEQSEIHFDLLSPEFFKALLQNNSVSGVVFMYWHEGILAGYNICLTHNAMLIDKYIGLRYPLARELNLYFISWLENLAYAREMGFSNYIAGWTDPEVKASLGASFTFTRHLVWVKNPVLRHILYPLRHLFEADSQLEL